jgi:hypothetical protein
MSRNNGQNTGRDDSRGGVSRDDSRGGVSRDDSRGGVSRDDSRGGRNGRGNDNRGRGFSHGSVSGLRRESFHPELYGAPYGLASGEQSDAARGSRPLAKAEIDIHETMKSILDRQGGRDDATYDTSKFPSYSPRLNMTGIDAINTTAATNTIVDGTAVSADGSVVLGPGLAGSAAGSDSGDTTARPSVNDIIKLGPSNRDSRPIGINDVYMYFDSWYKADESIPSLGLYSFNVQQINGPEPIKNIIEMQLMPFFAPKIETNAAYQPEYYFFKTILMEFTLISGRQITKSVAAAQNFHFELDVEDAGSAVLARPRNNLFIFTEPVLDITKINVQFKLPNQAISWPNDVFDVAAVEPSVLPPPGDRQLTTGTAHGLNVGQNYAVYFKNYNSISSVLNSIINNPLGHIATVIDATTLQLTNTPGANAIGSTPSALGGPPTAKMYVGPLRIAFSMRFRTVRRIETNFITPT